MKRLINGPWVAETPLPMTMMMMSLVLGIVTSAVGGHESTTLTFELPDKQKLCFYEEFTEGADMVFLFHVIKGGRYDVDVIVESPNGKAFYKQVRKQKDVVRFYALTGVYTFCFSNEFSSITHKVISLELRPSQNRPLAVEAGNNRSTANTQLEESMETIHGHVTKVIQHQLAYRPKEAIGRFVSMMLNRRVLWWSLLQAVLMVILGAGQVILLKCLFSEKRHHSVPVTGETAPVLHAVPTNDNSTVVLPPAALRSSRSNKMIY